MKIFSLFMAVLVSASMAFSQTSQISHDNKAQGAIFEKEQLKEIPERTVNPLLDCWNVRPNRTAHDVIQIKHIDSTSRHQLTRYLDENGNTKLGYIKTATSLQGTVTDAVTGEPIIFGTVALYKNGVLQTGTETDLDGFYSLTEIDPGKYEVEFSYTGYGNQKIADVNIIAGKANILDAKMSQGVDLTEVVVVYEAPLIEQDCMSSGAIFSKEQIKGMPTRNVNGTNSLGAGTSKKNKAGKKRRKKEYPTRGSREDKSEYFINGVKVIGDIELKNTPAKTAPEKNILAGTLTAGEINDFNSWELWQDIAAIDLENWQKHWQFHPNERYTVQAMTNQGQPIVDAEVNLYSENKTPLWTTRTDNTGRAELWANPFFEKTKTGNLYAKINFNGQIKKLDKVIEFKEGINTVSFDTPCEQPEEIDLLFVVDATGSMGDEINFLKSELTDVIEKAKNGLSDIKLNLGSIFYRDIRDEYLTRQSPFSENIKQTIEFIQKQNAGGGGDRPEAVEIALDEAILQMQWSKSARARFLFLVMDAPPHHTPEIIDELKTLSQEAAAKGIRIIPVAGSGTEKGTEYLTRSMALLTNGTYTFLTDDSGIGGTHSEPTSDVYEVEKLNELLVRIILQYAEIPDCEESLITRETEIINDKKLENKLKLKAFPNPSSGPLTIELKMDIDELYVTDLSGKILIRYADLKKGRSPINLSNLPNGSYMIRAQVNNQSVTERVVILH